MRKNFSIESVFLEKKLTYDISKFNSLLIMYLLSDLEVSYNRQLLVLGGIVEKSLEVDCKVIRVITKTILIFRYQVCTSYRVSFISYRGEYSDLVGTR